MNHHKLPSFMATCILTAVSAVAFLATFTGCDAPETTSPPLTDQVVQQKTLSFVKLSNDAYSPDFYEALGDLGVGGESHHRPVGLDEFNCLTRDFTARIHEEHLTNRNPIIIPGNLRFTRQDLENHLVPAAGCSAGTDSQRGIVVHLGLNATFQLDLALEFVCLKTNKEADGFETISNGQYYSIVGSALQGPANLTAWYAAGGNGKRFADHVVIDRQGNGKYEPFARGSDPESITFPFEGEIELLLNHSGFTPNDFVELVPTASPAAWQQIGANVYKDYNYSHGVAWKRHNVLPTNPVTTNFEFRDKAADLGSPCPPNCPIAKFKKFGVVNRPTCP